MTRTILTLVILAGVASAQEDRFDPARLFAKNCASCHTVPDPGLPADRVWMNQVRETT